MTDLAKLWTAHKFHSARSILLGAAGMLAATSLMNPRQSLAQSAAAPVSQIAVPRAAAAPKWEVVSIRPCSGGEPDQRTGGNSSPGRLRLSCMDVGSLIQDAYVTNAGGRFSDPSTALPVEGIPGSIKSERYSIDAEADGNPSMTIMLGPMLQSLLEDRFKVKIHHETKETPIYALTAAKTGSKLKPWPEGSCVPQHVGTDARPSQGQRRCQLHRQRSGGSGTVDAEGLDINDLIQFVLALDRPVVDKTGLTGLYNFHMEFALDQTTTPALAPPGTPPTAISDPAGAPSVFTAVQEQLGLKLEPTKEPRDLIVIDHVERPSEN